MSVLGDRLPMARMGLALVLANGRYWSTVAPVVRTQLDRWTRHAEGIPNPTLQDVALTNLREEGFNAQTTATLSTLAPPMHRKAVIEAIVALQVIYDYLDSLVEMPQADPHGDGHRLYNALLDAVVLDAEPRGDYYADTRRPTDGGYLERLVKVVRRALTQLPRRAAITEVSQHAAARCAEAQVHAHAHADSAFGDKQLRQWATSNASSTGLQWREFLAGAVSSTFALHALIAAAADPHTSQDQAFAIDEVYLSVSALTTLLDGLVDYKQDMRSIGHPGYIRFYEDHDAITRGLRTVIRCAAVRAHETPNEAYHLMTLVGVVAYYISAPTASSDFAQPVTEQIRQDLKPLITPTLSIMRAWRIAKWTRAMIASQMAC